MVKKLNGLYPELISCPGDTLREFLEEREMSQEELAIRTGYSAKHISEVLSGKKKISIKFANSLEYVFGMPASFWINLQNIYDNDILEVEKVNNIDKDELKVLTELKDVVKYCEENKMIDVSLNNSLAVLSMRRFLSVNNLVSISKLPIKQSAFRGSKKLKVNINVLYAWEKVCEYLIDKIEIKNKFDKELLMSKYDDIKQTMFLEQDKMIEELKKIFSECGIAFEVVHSFTGAPVQGYIKKKNDKVSLCMTMRQSFADIFWFTLFHEIGHLINDDFENLYIDYSFGESEVEKKADLFARNTLIDWNDYNTFREKGKLDIKSIKKFAETQRVKIGIVIGRIQNDIKDYSFMASYREKYDLNI